MRNRHQTVLLTGASEGLGLSAARQLAAKGANVILVARNVQRLQEALAQVEVSWYYRALLGVGESGSKQWLFV